MRMPFLIHTTGKVSHLNSSPQVNGIHRHTFTREGLRSQEDCSTDHNVWGYMVENE